MSYQKPYIEENSSPTKDSIVIEDLGQSKNEIKNEIITHEFDTFYGIKNESNIPFREVKLHTTKEQPPLEKLFIPTPIAQTVAPWQIITLILSITLLGFTKAFSSNRFKQSIKSLYKYGLAIEITREEKVFFHRSNIFFTIIQLLAMSLFLYQIRDSINTTNVETNNLAFFLLIISVLISVYILKYMFAKVLLFILNDKTIVSEYIFNVSLYNNLLGVLLLPILCITYFSSLPFSFILFYLVIPMMLLIFILRLIRLYFIGNSKGVSFFSIFLYICTLEILPLVVILRIFIIR